MNCSGRWEKGGCKSGSVNVRGKEGENAYQK